MIIPIISIISFTFIMWIFNKIFSVKVCSLCAGVSITWLWIFFGITFGKLSVDLYQLPLAILAGGTVVGLMYKLEENIKGKYILIWKTIFVVLGFYAVYGLATLQWIIVITSVVAITIVTLLLKINKLELKNKKSKQKKVFEDKMENCC